MWSPGQSGSLWMETRGLSLTTPHSAKAVGSGEGHGWRIYANDLSEDFQQLCPITNATEKGNEPVLGDSDHAR